MARACRNRRHRRPCNDDAVRTHVNSMGMGEAYLTARRRSALRIRVLRGIQRHRNSPTAHCTRTEGSDTDCHRARGRNSHHARMEVLPDAMQSITVKISSPARTAILVRQAIAPTLPAPTEKAIVRACWRWLAAGCSAAGSSFPPLCRAAWCFVLLRMPGAPLVAAGH